MAQVPTSGRPAWFLHGAVRSSTQQAEAIIINIIIIIISVVILLVLILILITAAKFQLPS